MIENFTQFEKDSRMIGEFIGLEMDMNDYPYKMKFPHFISENPVVPNPMVANRDFCEWADSYTVDGDTGGYCLSINSFEFNSDWSWLMFVVEKIENIKDEDGCYMYTLEMGRDYCTISRNTFKKEYLFSSSTYNNKKISVYNTVVKFIKWFNKNNKDE